MSVLKSVLVTGANRGLGLEFVKQYAAGSTFVFACCRNPDKATELQSLAKASTGKVHVLQLDVRNYDSFPRAVDFVSSVVGSEGLSCLLNNAGVYLKVDLLNGKPQLLIENFEVNSVTPLMLTRSFLPLLKAAATGEPKPVVANITAKMGSMTENTSGGHYAYRASKAALNMVSKSMSVDLDPRGIRVVCLHPGWVQTDMGGPKASMNTQTSISQMIQSIDRTSKGEFRNHIFRNFDGSEIPW